MQDGSYHGIPHTEPELCASPRSKEDRNRPKPVVSDSLSMLFSGQSAILGTSLMFLNLTLCCFHLFTPWLRVIGRYLRAEADAGIAGTIDGGDVAHPFP